MQRPREWLTSRAAGLGVDIDQPSVDLAVAAVMCPSTLPGYAGAAGVGAFEVLPIEGFGFWRFYRLP